jgi:replication initiation and membrane attachment protein DnaB
MHDDANILEEKERTLARYLEVYTTEEVLKEAQEYIPSLRSHSDVLRKLNKMKLPQPVINTLIYYVLATNNQKLITDKLLALADLCRKFNIKNAKEAIPFFKQYYSYHTQISQEG